MTKRVKTFAIFLPYASVVVGLYGFSNAWAAILLYHFGALLLIPRSSWAVLRMGWNWRAALPLCIVCAVGGVVVYLLWPVAGRDVVMRDALAGWGLGGVSWLTFIGYLTVVHPVVEELLWRAESSSDRALLSWRDLAFAGYHAPVLVGFLEPGWVAVSVVVLAGASAMWRYAVRSTGGLGAVVLSHALADLSVMVAVAAIMAA